MYVTQLPKENWQGIGWVFLNSAIAVVDRLLQRLLLSKEIWSVLGLVSVALGGWILGVAFFGIQKDPAEASEYQDMRAIAPDIINK